MADKHVGQMNIVEKVLQIYGPYAFSLVSLLVLWTMLVKPEMDSQRLDWAMMRTVVEQQNEIARSMNETSTNLLDLTRSLRELYRAADDEEIRNNG